MASDTVINLTGETIKMIDFEGKEQGEFPATDPAVEGERVQMQLWARNDNNQPVTYWGVLTDGPLHGLPDPEPRVKYIVSMPVALAACSRGRTIGDLLFVEGEVSDSDGRHRGWRYLRSA